MRTSRAVPESLIGAPFSRRVALEQVSPGQLRGPAFQRLAQGVHAAAGLPITNQERILALRVVIPPDAVLGGVSAAWAHGVQSAGGDRRVEVILPPARRVRSRPELIVRGGVLQPAEVVATRLGPATSGARTAFDLGRRLDIPPPVVAGMCTALATGSGYGGARGSRTARRGSIAPAMARVGDIVAQVDSVLRATERTVSAVDEIVTTHPAARGLRGLRLVLGLSDPRAESPPESMLRTRIILAGLPGPVPQFEVRGSEGEVVARVDLAWPDLKLALEYDGSHHAERRQLSADRARDTRLALLGWRVIHVDALLLRHPEQIIADLRVAIGC